MKIELIRLLNELIEEAVCDGSDPNRVYHKNSVKLYKAIENILKHLGIYDECRITEYDREGKCTHWSPFFIEEK